MRSLCLILLAVGAMAAPQASSEVAGTSPSADSQVGPPSPAAGGAIAALPSAASAKQTPLINVTDITVTGVLDEKTEEEVQEIANGFNQLRNLGVLHLEDEHLQEEEGIEPEAATFKIKKLVKLAKIALIVLASQNVTGNLSNTAMQVQQLVELLNVRDSGVASNALEVVRAAQEQTNVVEQLAFEEEEEATKSVAAVLAQAPDTAVASLQGAAHGQVLFAQSGEGTLVMGTIVGLRPGQHQLSIYERGNCRVPGQLFDHSGDSHFDAEETLDELMDDSGKFHTSKALNLLQKKGLKSAVTGSSSKLPVPVIGAAAAGTLAKISLLVLIGTGTIPTTVGSTTFPAPDVEFATTTTAALLDLKNLLTGNNTITAIVELETGSPITGELFLAQTSTVVGGRSPTLVTGTLKGLDEDMSYRIDVATNGELDNGCSAAGAVYSATSGGEFVADADGRALLIVSVENAPLTGIDTVWGRSIVIATKASPTEILACGAIVRG